MERGLIAILALITAVVLIAGCTAPQDGADGGTNEETENGGTSEQNGGVTGGDMTSWCQAGQVWTGTGTGVTGEISIVGIEQYQGEQRCHYRSSYESYGITTTIDMYCLDQECDDMWFTYSSGSTGGWTYHIVNEQCVAGDCTYWGE